MSTREGQALREENRAILTELLRRLGTQDYHGACAMMTEDVLCDWPYLPMPGLAHEIRGRDAMEAFFAGGMSAFEPYRYEITAVFDLLDPNRLIAEYRSNSTFKPSGAPYQNHYVGIFEFQDGAVSYWREYINPDTVARVLATAPASARGDTTGGAGGAVRAASASSRDPAERPRPRPGPGTSPA
ncbi:MAG: nuclear transport factor 2 family protein [Spirochaetaceae bacterium]|nr:nuclear transport factor 2 family protein [Myxococcales bacterium]MCB9724787.1 nuclear transport factor 2 family protein [Spirochaetaceae bacterium]HPG24470.1 nuclear transport factor 2 family protein [Myxococcota bacterium]